LVIETLQKQDKDKRCFRLVGGVLVERKVGEVEPALVNNREKLGKLIDTLEKQLTEKGQEINAYIEKHNIQIQGKKDRTEQKAIEEPTKPSTGVLVSPSEGSSSN
jgi:prefoldin subunit 2